MVTLAADKLKKQVMYIANWYKTTTEEASRLFYNQDIAVCNHHERGHTCLILQI